MYSYIKGTLEEVREDLIVIENNGIGYNIYVPARFLDELPRKGSMLKIHTYLHVREDAMLLFGFPSEDELQMFKLLINVTGIGPKGGLGILSFLSPNDIRFAVVSEDVKTICRAPGIGKKTAQRLIIELKDKVHLEEVIGETADISGADISLNNTVRKEAAEALTALGYSSAEAAKVLSGIDITEDTDVETVLKAALKNLSFL